MDGNSLAMKLEEFEGLLTGIYPTLPSLWLEGIN
jgi:hypothetical protein